MLSYYKRGLGQLHPNGWINLSLFEKFYRFFGLKPMVNILKNRYQLDVGTDYGNDMHWFFTFANKPTSTIKGMLSGKPPHVKKCRRR